MPDSPYGAMPPGPAPWPQQGPRPARGPSRLPVFLALGVALVALGLAIGAWFRPTTTTPAAPTTPQYSEQEVADAKTAVCEAYDTVLNSIRATASRTSADPTLTFMLTVDSRLVFHVAGEYLAAQLNANPATPPELATPVRNLTQSYTATLLAQFADADKAELDSHYATTGAAEKDVIEACK